MKVVEGEGGDDDMRQFVWGGNDLSENFRANLILIPLNNFTMKYLFIHVYINIY